MYESLIHAEILEANTVLWQSIYNDDYPFQVLFEAAKSTLTSMDISSSMQEYYYEALTYPLMHKAYDPLIGEETKACSSFLESLDSGSPSVTKNLSPKSIKEFRENIIKHLPKQPMHFKAHLILQDSRFTAVQHTPSSPLTLERVLSIIQGIADILNNEGIQKAYDAFRTKAEHNHKHHQYNNHSFYVCTTNKPLFLAIWHKENILLVTGSPSCFDEPISSRQTDNIVGNIVQFLGQIEHLHCS